MKKHLKRFCQKLVKNYTSFFLLIFLISPSHANGFQRIKYLFESSKKDTLIDKIYNENLIPYSEYDDFNNQLKTFLGLYSVPSDKSFFPDLMSIDNSLYIREIYKSKLNNMTINQNNYMIENKSFFKN